MDQTERDNKQARLSDLSRMQMPSDAEKAEMVTLKADLSWKPASTFSPPPTNVADDKYNPTNNTAGYVKPAAAPGPVKEKQDFLIVDKPNKNLNAAQNRYYDTVFPYNDIDVEQGVFIPVKDGQTIDQLSAQLGRAIAGSRYQHGEIEHDINGDEVYETVSVMSTKTENGKLVLNSDGTPLMSPNSIQRPKLVYARNYILRTAKKDDDLGDGQKAPSDGVLIIRTI